MTEQRNIIYNHKKYEQLKNKIKEIFNCSAIYKSEMNLKLKDMERIKEWLLYFDRSV